MVYETLSACLFRSSACGVDVEAEGETPIVTLTRIDNDDDDEDKIARLKKGWSNWKKRSRSKKALQEKG